MQSLILVLAIGAGLLIVPGGPSRQAQGAAKSLKVVFVDGGELVVTDWTFVYKYREKLTAPFYQEITKTAQDLMLVTGSRTERGLTVVDTRTLSLAELRRITFDWEKSANNEHTVKNIMVTLASGEILRLEGLKPALGLLSKEPDVWGEGIYLEGLANLNGKQGRFSKRLDEAWTEDPTSELVRQIEF